MKKRLLITSIVMMLVVAVALSTATYAWFTSNAKVDMGTMTLKAATSDADAIGIGWLNGESGTEISSDLYDVLKPMAPESLTVGGNDATTSEVTFRSATSREEDSVIVFNNDVVNDRYVQVSDLASSEQSPYYTLDGSTRKAKAGVDYYTANGDLTPAAGVSVGDNVGSKYIRMIAPILYNNEEVSAFYVKNLSTANPISRVDVYANFTASDVYVLTTDKTFRNKANFYYKRTGEEGSYSYIEQTVSTTTSLEGNTIKVGDTVPSNTYYQLLDGNDLIRVALFTKAAYKNGTDTPAATYTLLGVLGNNATTFTRATAFDKNTTYYTAATYSEVEVTSDTFATAKTTGLYERTGTAGNYVYTALVGDETFVDSKTYCVAATYAQTAHIDAFTAGTIYYTAANTAVFGAQAKFTDGTVDTKEPVKDLGHYIDVKTSLTLDTNIQPENQVDIVAIAWLDGTLLDDDHAGVMGQVSLYFKTV